MQLWISWESLATALAAFHHGMFETGFGAMRLAQAHRVSSQLWRLYFAWYRQKTFVDSSESLLIRSCYPMIHASMAFEPGHGHASRSRHCSPDVARSHSSAG